MANEFIIRKGFNSLANSEITGSLTVTAGITGSLQGTASFATTALSASYLSGSVLNAVSASYASTASFLDGTILNILTVGKSGSDNVDYYSIKDAVDSITGASETNPYLVQVYPGVFIENTITMKSWVTVKGDSSISTIVSASNASQSLFVGADQSMIIDMQIQGVTAPSASAVVYSSPTTPQTNAIFYVENVRFGANYTHAKVVGTSGGNCIMQCSNVKYGGYPFTLGFYVTNDGSGIGRMQLRNVTSTNGGVTTTTGLIFAKADQPGCAFIVNGCLLTKAVEAAAGTGFWVENGGSLRLTAVNFQRWANGIYAPNVGSAPSIFGSALNFENNTTDVLVEHPTATGKIEGTDSFLRTTIPLEAPLYEVNQDPRRITVSKKGGDFTSISASVAYISGSSTTNRFVIDVGPGAFTEKTIDLRGKPYVSIVGSDIQTTQIIPSGSHDQFILGSNNEISSLTVAGNSIPGYAAFVAEDLNGTSLIHKVSIDTWDYGVKVISNASSSQFYGEYVDINGPFSYGTYVSSSNGVTALANMENYYLFPSGSNPTVGNYAIGSAAQIGLYTALFQGNNNSGSIAITLQNGATLEAAAVDIQDWEYGFTIPNSGSAPNFRMVGSMFHNSITKDFLIEQTSTQGRFQGISDHSKITNNSPDFYWNFLDDVDGENDVTRKLSVTFEDGTHTDATTLIFNGSAMGVQEGGEISIVTGLTASVSGGFGYLEIPNTEIYKRLDWPNTQIILPSSSNNYIYFNDNQVLLSGGTSPSPLTNIILGRVVTNQTDIAFIDQSPYLGAHTANLLSTFNKQALGPVYAEGSIVTQNAISYSLDVTAGNYFFSENQFLPAGGTGITFTRYYASGSVFNTTSTTTVPSNVYNSGSSLIPMSSSYYTKHSLYVVGQGIDEQYFLVVGQNQYATLVETEDANLPLPPTYFSDGVVSVASIYVQSGSAGIIQIEDIRPVIGFKASGVNASSVHGNLLGLAADDHTQYLLVDGAREMAADLGLGGNDIYNVNSVTATQFIGDLSGTASYALNGGVTSIIAGSGITLPTGGTGNVTIVAPGTTTIISGSSVTSSFTNSNTWTFNHNLGTRTPIITVFDSNYNQIVPQNIQLVDTASATITFPTLESGFAIASTGGTTSSLAISSSYSLFSTYASTASYYNETDPVFVSKQATLATTGSNNFKGNQIITGSLTVSGSSTFTNIGPTILSGSLFISGTTEFGGNLVPKTARGATLGTVDRPFSDIFVSSGSINIASDDPGSPNTILSNVSGNIVFSAGGIRLVGTGSFIAATGSFGYISGSMTQVGNYTQVGNKVISGSLIVTTGITGSLLGTASYASKSEPISSIGTTIYSTTPATSNVSTTNGIFLGSGAGNGASLANRSVFFGTNAGLNASNANDSLFIGSAAGNNAENADHSVFIGPNAGGQATDLNNSLVIGTNAGYYAKNANHSILIGNQSGYFAGSASYCTLLGYNVGSNPDGGDAGVKSNNIIIGTNITLPNGTKDSINLGGVIFATGSYATTSGNPSFVATPNAKVGIGVVTPQYTLDVSGSGRYSNGLIVTGSLNISGSTHTVQKGFIILQQVSQSLNFVDDTAAAAGGVPLGGLYRNGNFIAIRIS